MTCLGHVPVFFLVYARPSYTYISPVALQMLQQNLAVYPRFSPGREGLRAMNVSFDISTLTAPGLKIKRTANISSSTRLCSCACVYFIKLMRYSHPKQHWSLFQGFSYYCSFLEITSTCVSPTRKRFSLPGVWIQNCDTRL